jgi:hypothetical protein
MSSSIGNHTLPIPVPSVATLVHIGEGCQERIAAEIPHLVERVQKAETPSEKLEEIKKTALHHLAATASQPISDTAATYTTNVIAPTLLAYAVPGLAPILAPVALLTTPAIAKKYDEVLTPTLELALHNPARALQNPLECLYAGHYIAQRKKAALNDKPLLKLAVPTIKSFIETVKENEGITPELPALKMYVDELVDALGFEILGEQPRQALCAVHSILLEILKQNGRNMLVKRRAIELLTLINSVSAKLTNFCKFNGDSNLVCEILKDYIDNQEMHLRREGLRAQLHHKLLCSAAIQFLEEEGIRLSEEEKSEENNKIKSDLNRIIEVLIGYIAHPTTPNYCCQPLANALRRVLKATFSTQSDWIERTFSKSEKFTSSAFIMTTIVNEIIEFIRWTSWEDNYAFAFKLLKSFKEKIPDTCIPALIQQIIKVLEQKVRNEDMLEVIMHICPKIPSEFFSKLIIALAKIDSQLAFKLLEKIPDPYIPTLIQEITEILERKIRNEDMLKVIMHICSKIPSELFPKLILALVKFDDKDFKQNLITKQLFKTLPLSAYISCLTLEKFKETRLEVSYPEIKFSLTEFFLGCAERSLEKSELCSEQKAWGIVHAVAGVGAVGLAFASLFAERPTYPNRPTWDIRRTSIPLWKDILPHLFEQAVSKKTWLIITYIDNAPHLFALEPPEFILALGSTLEEIKRMKSTPITQEQKEAIQELAKENADFSSIFRLL